MCGYPSTNTNRTRANRRTLRSLWLRGSRPFDSSSLDVVEIGEIPLEVGVAERLDHTLIGRLTIPRIQRVDDSHPVDDATEGCKAHGIEPPIVDEVDEGL